MDALLTINLNDDAKEVAQELKPEEEIQRFTVDEHLSDIERVNLFLTGGQLVQQHKAIESLPALLKARGRAGWDAVRDNLLFTLKQLDVEAQIATADALCTAAQQRALQSADAAECLLPLAVGGGIKAKDKTEEESEAWLLLLLELLPVVGSAQLLEQVLPLALSRGKVNEPVASRVVCCRLLGAMAPHLAPPDVSARFASQLLAACQDTDYQVRIAAAQQLPVLARMLGHASTVNQLLPELTELLKDDEVQVRMAALNSMVALWELVPREARIATLLPLVRQHMQPLELELPLQRTLAAAFPQLLDAVRDDLQSSDAGLMYSCFRHLAARTDVELRRTCALKVSELMGAPLPGSSPSYLHDTWTDLAMDHDEQVRVAIASQLHVVAQQAEPPDATLLRRPLTSLLRDSSPQVRKALLAGLADTLQVLCHVDEMHRDGLAADIHQSLLVLLGNLGNSWRCQQHVAAALPYLAELLGPEVLAEHWAPFAFGLLLNGAASVKPVAARGLACLLRGCRRERPRTELYCRTIRELAWGRSCWARLAYVQLCAAALSMFSCRWFKEHLLVGVMELLADSVPNVRLAALGLLPSLKQTIRLPEDVQQLEQLNSAMSNLMTDNDRDVAHAARSLHATFKRTPLRMTGGAGLLDMNGSSSSAAAAEFEADDRAKEEAEAELTLSQEELERLNIEWCAVNAERRGRRNPLLAMPDAGSSSGSGCGHMAAMRSTNSRGKLDVAAGAGSSSSKLMGGSGAATPSGSTASSASLWSGAAYERRFGSGAASSSSTNAGSGMSLRAAATTAAAAAGFSSLTRGGAGRCAASNASSSTTFNGGSPRQGALGGSNSSNNIAGYPGGFGSPPSPLASPTGSSLMAHMRLPVLAASPKAGTSGSGSNAQAGSLGNSSGSSNSAAGMLGASRLASGVIGLQSNSTGPSSSSAANVGKSGNSTASSSLFGRHVDSAKGKAGSSFSSSAQSKPGIGVFASSNSSSKAAGSSRMVGGASSGFSSPTGRDAAARRFK